MTTHTLPLRKGVFFMQSDTVQNDAAQPRRALIFANGDLNDGPAVQAALNTGAGARIIAADGGARLALACARVPHVVVGDMDSLSAGELDDLRVRGALIERHDPAKDETDLELALLYAVRSGARWIRIFGAIGGRIDQTLANITLLALDALADCDVRLVSGDQTLWLISPGAHAIHGARGDTLSLIPLAGDAVNTRTEGLDYPLRGETLYFGPARGVSNVLSGAAARVTLEAGRLVVVHTPGTPA